MFTNVWQFNVVVSLCMGGTKGALVSNSMVMLSRPTRDISL
jgi:hypothetical protein